MLHTPSFADRHSRETDSNLRRAAETPPWLRRAMARQLSALLSSGSAASGVADAGATDATGAGTAPDGSPPWLRRRATLRNLTAPHGGSGVSSRAEDDESAAAASAGGSIARNDPAEAGTKVTGEGSEDDDSAEDATGFDRAVGAAAPSSLPASSTLAAVPVALTAATTLDDEEWRRAVALSRVPLSCLESALVGSIATRIIPPAS